MGAPHLNPLVYPTAGDRASLFAGTGIELVLTFFLTFAIFGGIAEVTRARSAALVRVVSDCLCTVRVPSDRAATNPARWVRPVLWEWMLPKALRSLGGLVRLHRGPYSRAMLAGTFYFKVMLPVMKRTRATERADFQDRHGSPPGR